MIKNITDFLDDVFTVVYRAANIPSEATEFINQLENSSFACNVDCGNFDFSANINPGESIQFNIRIDSVNGRFNYQNDFLKIALASTDLTNQSFQCEISKEATKTFFTVRNISFTLEILVANNAIPPFTYKGDIKISSDQLCEFNPVVSFSFPDIEVGNTGIVLAARNVVFDFSKLSDASNPIISADCSVKIVHKNLLALITNSNLDLNISDIGTKLQIFKNGISISSNGQNKNETVRLNLFEIKITRWNIHIDNTEANSIYDFSILGNVTLTDSIKSKLFNISLPTDKHLSFQVAKDNDKLISKFILPLNSTFSMGNTNQGSASVAGNNSLYTITNTKDIEFVFEKDPSGRFVMKGTSQFRVKLFGKDLEINSDTEIKWTHGRPARILNELEDYSEDKLEIHLTHTAFQIPLGINTESISFDSIDLCFFANNPNQNKRLIGSSFTTSWNNIYSLLPDDGVKVKLNELLQSSPVKINLLVDQIGEGKKFQFILDSTLNINVNPIEKLVGIPANSLDVIFPEITNIQLHCEADVSNDSTDGFKFATVIKKVTISGQFDFSQTIYNSLFDNENTIINSTLSYTDEAPNSISIDFTSPVKLIIDLPNHPTNSDPLSVLSLKNINIEFDSITHKPISITLLGKLEFNLPAPLNNLLITEPGILKPIKITLPDFDLSQKQFGTNTIPSENIPIPTENLMTFDLSQISPGFNLNGNVLKIKNIVLAIEKNILKAFQVQCMFETHLNLPDTFNLNIGSGLLCFSIEIDSSDSRNIKYKTNTNVQIGDINAQASNFIASIQGVILDNTIDFNSSNLNELSSTFHSDEIKLKYRNNSELDLNNISGDIEYNQRCQKISFKIDNFKIKDLFGTTDYGIPDVLAKCDFLFEKRIAANVEYLNLLLKADSELTSSNLDRRIILPLGLPNNIVFKFRVEFSQEKTNNNSQHTKTLLIYETELNQINGETFVRQFIPNIPLLDLTFKNVKFHAQIELADNSTGSSAAFKSFISADVVIPKFSLGTEVERMLKIELGKLIDNNHEYNSIKIKFEIDAAAGSNNASAQVKAVIEDVGRIGIKLPGLRKTNDPQDNILASLDSASFNATVANSSSNGGSTTSASALISFAGAYHFHLDLSSLPIPEEFKQVFSFAEKFAGDPDLRGKLEATLELALDNQGDFVWTATGICKLEEFGLDLKINEILSFFSNGGMPDGYKKATEIMTDGLEFGCSIDYIKIVLSNKLNGRKNPNGISPPTIRVCGTLRFLTATVPLFFELNNNTIALGVDEMEIPLKLSLPPFEPSMFTCSTNDTINEDWFNRRTRRYNSEIFINSGNAKIKRNLLIQKAIIDLAGKICLTINDNNGRVKYLNILKFLAQQYQQVFNFSPNEDSGNTQPTFELKGFPFISIEQGGLDTLFSSTDKDTFSTNLTKLIKIDETAKLILGDIRLELNLQEIRKSGFSGKLKLKDFQVDNPLKILEIIEWQFGLSTDVFYFSLKTPGKIYFPKIGNWEGVELDEMITKPGTPSLTAAQQLEKDRKGYIGIDKAMVGFGYTKRSLALQLEGEVRLPESFMEAIQHFQETSSNDLFYLLPPRKTNLYVRFELIPIPVGQIVIVVPYFEFSLDMRSDFSKGLVSTADCVPYWDGLQFHLKNVFEADIKKIGFSPLFLGDIAPVFPHAFDLKVGDDLFGFTLIADNVNLCMGKFVGYTIVPYAFLYDPYIPWADNICLQMRFGGFGINMNFQRPIPSVGLDAILEVLALISDPGYQINSNGSLGNCMRIALTDVHLIIPDYARKFFPHLSNKLTKSVNLVVNAATFQHLFAGAYRVLNRIKNNLPSQQAIELYKAELTRIIQEEINSIDFNSIVQNILKSLPLNTRSFSTHVNLGGFESEASVGMISIEEINEMIDNVNTTTNENTVLQLTDEGEINFNSSLDEFKKVKTESFKSKNPGRSNGFNAEFFDGDNVALFNASGGFGRIDDIKDSLNQIAQIIPRQSNGFLTRTTINLFALQHIDFIGYIWKINNHDPLTGFGFCLLSAIDSPELKLTFGQMVVPIPLSIKGQLKLSYSSPGSGTDLLKQNITNLLTGVPWSKSTADIALAALTGTGFIEGEFTAEWDVIPEWLKIKLGGRTALDDSTGTITFAPFFMPFDFGYVFSSSDVFIFAEKNSEFVIDILPKIKITPGALIDTLNFFIHTNDKLLNDVELRQKEDAKKFVKDLKMHASEVKHIKLKPVWHEFPIIETNNFSALRLIEKLNEKASTEYNISFDSVARLLTLYLSVDKKKIKYNANANLQAQKIKLDDKTGKFNFYLDKKIVNKIDGDRVAKHLENSLNPYDKIKPGEALFSAQIKRIAKKLLSKGNITNPSQRAQVTVGWDKAKQSFKIADGDNAITVTGNHLIELIKDDDVKYVYKQENSPRAWVVNDKWDQAKKWDNLIQDKESEDKTNAESPFHPIKKGKESKVENPQVEIIAEPGPCTLYLDSKGKFIISGNGQMQFFEKVKGLKAFLECSKILILNNYCYGSGNFIFEYTPEDNKILEKILGVNSGTLLSIKGDMSGQIGPQDHFEFKGKLTDQVHLLGLNLTSSTSFLLNERTIQLKCSAGPSILNIFGFTISIIGYDSTDTNEVPAEIETLFQLIDERISFSLSGNVALNITRRDILPPKGITIKGKSGFSFDTSGKFTISTEGEIDWYGEKITSGKIEISENYFDVEGDLKLSLSAGLISQYLPALINSIPFLPYLNLNANFGFSIKNQNQFSVNLKGNFDFGIKKQVLDVNTDGNGFSLFKGKIPDIVENIAVNASGFEIPIVNFSGGNLMPFNSIPFPKINVPTKKKLFIIEMYNNPNFPSCTKIYLVDKSDDGTLSNAIIFIDFHIPGCNKTHDNSDRQEKFYWDFSVPNGIPDLENLNTNDCLCLPVPTIMIPSLDVKLKWTPQDKFSLEVIHNP
ncbi:MAG: hypothetical protein ABI723_24145 [Bacteroidia bacterium]